MEFRNIGFCGEEKTEVPRGKPLGDKSENQQQNQPSDVTSRHMTWSTGGTRTRSTFVSAFTNVPLLLSKANDRFLVFSLKVLSELV